MVGIRLGWMLLWFLGSSISFLKEKGSLDRTRELGRKALIKFLILKIFEVKNKEWEEVLPAILRVLSNVKRQGFKDLGLQPVETVKEHTLGIVTLVEEIAEEKGWNASRTRLATLIAYIHDLVEAWGQDIPLIKKKLPFRRTDRVIFQLDNVAPATAIEERRRLLAEYGEEKRILSAYLNGMEVSRTLKWAILWCFTRYYFGDTEEAVLVQQCHHLQTVLKAKSYEDRRNPWFAEKRGAEPFFVRVEQVITDQNVRERFERARIREEYLA